MDKKDLLGAVWRKALGYTTTESVEEYSSVDGQMVVSKQKVTTKEVAPDITAAKLLFEQTEGEFERMTDEELLAEKERLLLLLQSGCVDKNEPVIEPSGIKPSRKNGAEIEPCGIKSSRKNGAEIDACGIKPSRKNEPGTDACGIKPSQKNEAEKDAYGIKPSRKGRRALRVLKVKEGLDIEGRKGDEADEGGQGDV